MTNFFRAAGLAGTFALIAGGASALTVNQDFGPYDDIDDAGGTSFDFNVADMGTITDLDLMLTFNEGSGSGSFIFLNDLEMTLSHLGTSVLFADNSAGNFPEPFVVTFDDDGGGTSPSNPLSAFDGLEAAGVWTISFLDTSCCPGEQDQLTLGTLILEIDPPAPVPLPASGLLLLGGLAIGAAARRKRS